MSDSPCDVPATVVLESGQTVRLGRVRPAARPVAVRFASVYSPVEGKPAPASVDYLSKSTASIKQMYGNDQWGDCVIAGKFHAVGVWSGNDAGTAVLGTTSEAVSEYHRICGPGDNGCVITEVLNEMKANGLTIGGHKHKIDGYVSVDTTNKEEVKVAVLLFGGVCIGFNVPASFMNTPDGGTWDNNVPMNFVGGHDVYIIDYDDEKGVRLATWAGTRWMTWRCLADSRIVDECYAMLAPDWYNDDDLAPNGVNVQKLKDALATIDAGGLPPWEPDPTPVPPVPPTPPVPPVPPTPPAPVVAPTYAVSLSGSFPSGIWGTPKTVILTGVATPAQGMNFSLAPHAEPRSAIPWFVIIGYVAKAIPIVIADVRAGKTFAEIVSDVFNAFFPAGVLTELKGWTPEQWRAAIVKLVAFILSLFGYTPPTE